MKFLKYALLMLLCACFIDLSLIYAYGAPPVYFISKELSKNTALWSEWRTKNTYTYQEYENRRTYTILKDPCPTCQVAAKPYGPVKADGSRDVYSAVVTTENQTKRFTDPTTVHYPNDYILSIWRVDFTLLKTAHSSAWKINS